MTFVIQIVEGNKYYVPCPINVKNNLHTFASEFFIPEKRRCKMI